MIEDWSNLSKEDIRMIIDIKRMTAETKIAHPDVDKELNDFWKNHQTTTEETKRIPLWRHWYVASLVAVFVICIFLTFFIPFGNKSREGLVIYTATAQAKKLTISANGKTYTLNKNLPSQALSALNVNIDGRAISLKSNSIQKYGTRTLYTPCGEIYTLTLSDGTVIHLNAASRITFPTTFNGKNRTVYLHGEAFIEVAHDSVHPFVVQTDYFKATALGTKFNIKAYSQSQANVVLMEGKVMINKKAASPIFLSPEEQVVLLQNGMLSKHKIDSYPYKEWQNGFFYFDKAPLSEIMLELGRWYNVDVVFKNQKVLNETMHFVADRNDNLQQAINNLNELGMFHLDFANNKIIVH
jgi:transmembrane sensor